MHPCPENKGNVTQSVNIKSVQPRFDEIKSNQTVSPDSIFADSHIDLQVLEHVQLPWLTRKAKKQRSKSEQAGKQVENGIAQFCGYILFAGRLLKLRFNTSPGHLHIVYPADYLLHSLPLATAQTRLLDLYQHRKHSAASVWSLAYLSNQPRCLSIMASECAY